MKTFLEKLSRYWQLRFIAVAAGVALVVYAVLLPDAGSRDGSIQAVAAAPLLPESVKSGPDFSSGSTGLLVANDAAFGSNRPLSSDSHVSWQGANRAVADQLEMPVQAIENSELPRDFSESIRRLRNAANHGNSTAQFLLGHAYELGFGVRKGMNEAILWYARAGEARSADAGMKPEKDFQHAFETYRADAEQGDAGAQLYLGLAYDLGQDVTRDPVEAARWYRRAAARGSASAASNLGVLYHNGDGMAKDSVEAANWFTNAATRGSASAQYSLGRMYFTGDGVAASYAEAAKWLEKSATQGNASAQILLSYLYATAQGVPGSTPLAYMWIDLASANEDLAKLSRTQIEKVAAFNEIEAGQQLTHEWLKHHPQSTQ